MTFLFGLLIGVIFGAWFAWGVAHTVIAEECEKLGGFFVGDRVFKCIEVKHGD